MQEINIVTIIIIIFQRHLLILQLEKLLLITVSLKVNMDGVNGQAVGKPKVFTYNVVFEPEASQEDTIEHSGVKRLIDMAIDGFSCTVFCYGQTGSGKTHTLTGPPYLVGKLLPSLLK